jgi:chemotaxis protein MotA
LDFGTILGVITGISLILSAIFLESGLGLFMSVPALMIVLGGTIASTLIGYPLKDLMKVLGVARHVFFAKSKDPSQLMIALIHLASEVKRRGKLKLPALAQKIDSAFVQKGAQLIADRISAESIKRTLQTEMLITQQRHRLGREIFTQMARYAPAFGMIGTLIGLVQMLSQLHDPSTIGSRMALAILTTFYGAVLANLFFMPMANKLKRRSEEEVVLMQICYEALLSIEAEDSITLMEDKLASFISSGLQHELAVNRKRRLDNNSDG